MTTDGKTKAQYADSRHLPTIPTCRYSYIIYVQNFYCFEQKLQIGISRSLLPKRSLAILSEMDSMVTIFSRKFLTYSAISWNSGSLVFSIHDEAMPLMESLIRLMRPGLCFFTEVSSWRQISLVMKCNEVQREPCPNIETMQSFWQEFALAPILFGYFHPFLL